MIKERILLEEEEVPFAAMVDEEFLHDLNECERARLASEAREEMIRRQQSTRIDTLFDGLESKRYDYVPRRTKITANSAKELAQAIMAERKRAYEAYRASEAAQKDWAAEMNARKRRSYVRDHAKGGEKYFDDLLDESVQLLHLTFTLGQVEELTPGTQAWYETWLWLRIPYRGAMSFGVSCQTLGIDPQSLLEQLEQMRKQTQSYESWVSTERQLLVLEIAECEAMAQSHDEWLHVAELRDRLHDLNDKASTTDVKGEIA